MAKFTVNGRAVTVENNQKLLRYLRDTLHLTSVKDGCSEGACGTCTVLVDGMEVGHGAGDSKKEAEQHAAFSVSQYMTDEQCASLLDRVDRLTQ